MPDCACRAARAWQTGPTSQPKYCDHLRRHRARIADYVPPAIPERRVAGQCRHVVPPHVPERLADRVSLPAVQLDDDMPCAVTNVAIPVTTPAPPVLRGVPDAGRKADNAAARRYVGRANSKFRGNALEAEPRPGRRAAGSATADVAARFMLPTQPVRRRHPTLCSRATRDRRPWARRRGGSVTIR